MSSRREAWKRLGLSADQSQEKRRQDAMDRQKQARRDLTMHVRSIAFPLIENELEEISIDMELNTMDILTSKSRKKTREDRIKSKRDHFSNQFMYPEWMVDIPSNLNGNNDTNGNGWYVLSRPDGKRCLVISSNGRTIARTTSGSILKRFPSALPNGSRKTNIGQDQYCILDCIYHENDETFYVLDIMCWKGYLLYDCTAEFRFYWLYDKLTETSVDVVTSANPYRFQTIPFYECDSNGLERAYFSPTPYLKDGLLFYCKAGMYTLGLSPLVLLWRDQHTSPYVNQLSLVLRVQEDLSCVTLENLSLYTFSSEFAEKHEIIPGDMVRFNATGIEWSMNQDGTTIDVQVHGLTFQKRCSIQRGIPDTWTKLAHVNQATCSMAQLQMVVDQEIDGNAME